MTLSEKIIILRKRNGWSQEELAEKMNVSRQAVSKWESSQSAPEIDKILQLGALFGVSTDFLLKDEITDNTIEEYNKASSTCIKRVTLTEAEDYIAQRKKSSVLIAVATFMCIFSVIPLLLLGAASEVGKFEVSENFAGGIGIVFLLVFVAAAVSLFVFCDFKNSPYKYLEKGEFIVEKNAIEKLIDIKNTYASSYAKLNIAATCICILSPIPLFTGAFIDNDFLMVALLALTMIIAGLGVMLFIVAGVRSESIKRLIEDGNISEKEKKIGKFKNTISSVYWLLITTAYLLYSFTTDDWNSSWIIWPVAGVLFAAVMVICNHLTERKR